MSDIKIPFSSLSNPETGIKLVSKTGEDVTAKMLKL